MNISETKLTGEWQDAEPGIRRRIMIDGEKVMLVEVHFEAGAVGSVHKHPHEQATHVLAGRVRFTLSEQELELTAGQYLLIPSNTMHGTVALEKSVLLDVFSPPRQDFRDY
jgi:quercetin dioxygenase-like cupin family protein